MLLLYSGSWSGVIQLLLLWLVSVFKHSDTLKDSFLDSRKYSKFSDSS